MGQVKLRNTRVVFANVFILIFVFFLTSLQAQYFGRNKVQYEHFDFRVMHGEHFEIYYYPREEVVTRDGARMAERWYFRHSRDMNHQFSTKKPIIFYADQPDFQQTTAIQGMLSEGTGGVTEPLKNRVVLPFTGWYRENDHVLGHELVHAFQFDIMGKGGSGLNTMQRLPLWMVEGLAEYYSLGSVDPHTAMWIRDAMLFDDLPTVRDLTTKTRYFPYRYGHALYAFIDGMWGNDAVMRIFRAAARMGPEVAIDTVLGVSSDSLSALWHQIIRKTYQPLLEGRTLPREVGRQVLAPSHHGGRMNLAPVLSPDGQLVAFLSEKDIFGIDLFVADARTGKTVRKLSSMERNFHFDALSFVNSSGTWSPDGKRFAVVVYARGNQEIAIFDVRSGKLLRQIGFPKVGAISCPAWSPDGHYLSFSGMEGGMSNLYLYDLLQDSLHQLTRNRYADLQPAWSPDGQMLAFVTDSSQMTDFGQLTFGPLRIALLHLDTGEITFPIPMNRGKQINPQFSPDGNSLYFISDQDGFSDIYRWDFTENQLYRVTRVATGVSGLTAYSPALSVAQRSGDMMFSVFEHGNYNVYSLQAAESRGTPCQPTSSLATYGGFLPPVLWHKDRLVDSLLHDPASGLPLASDYKTSPYRPHFQLDYIGGQANIGISTNRYQNVAGGGLSLLMSDMLGQHVLAGSFLVNGELENLGGQILYENLTHRWNWGLSVSHVPYISTAQEVRDILWQIDGTIYPATEVMTLKDNVFYEEGRFLFYFPLNTMNRLEWSTGITYIWYYRKLITRVLLGDYEVFHHEEKLPVSEPITQFHTALAFVGDDSYFGFTSPTRGSRYRFEVQPFWGDLHFQSLLLDYRHYTFYRPFTFALRLFHYGYYGKDADSPALSPFFLGTEDFIRGYSYGSFSAQECASGGEYNNQCPVYDRLVGSKIAVVNLEFRIPVLGNENFGLWNFPYLPTELNFFFDGGTAWTNSEPPVLKWSTSSPERIPVFSVGAGVRVNFMGYLIIEGYLAHPFQRPKKAWVTGIHIAPGW